MTCPYPVIDGMGICCGREPCAVEWRRQCEDDGGCIDRSTCGDCAEPIFPDAAEGK